MLCTQTHTHDPSLGELCQGLTSTQAALLPLLGELLLSQQVGAAQELRGAPGREMHNRSSQQCPTRLQCHAKNTWKELCPSSPRQEPKPQHFSCPPPLCQGIFQLGFSVCPLQLVERSKTIHSAPVFDFPWVRSTSIPNCPGNVPTPPNTCRPLAGALPFTQTDFNTLKCCLLFQAHSPDKLKRNQRESK